MIVASHLTKRYPGRKAVEDLSFEVGNRVVTGLLGPNGSGKSTTIRMLCAYLAPTAGTARVAGFDVSRHPLEVRRRIGYLPENCPLYHDMRVDEYLRFRAAIKGVPHRQRKQRIGEVKELCGLGDTGRRMIGQLSKGYRQRVGLAEAMVHDPELLILDEPTIGLDPNQIRQTRELIRSLGERHTILLSTHILSEVEAVCRGVIIINKGRLVAAGKTSRFIHDTKTASRIFMEIKVDDAASAGAELRAWPEVTTVDIATTADWMRICLRANPGTDPRVALAAWASARGHALRELRREEATLEDVFVALTGESRKPETEPHA